MAGAGPAGPPRTKLAKVVNAPTPYSPQPDEKSVFLAGSIDYEAASEGRPSWRELLIASLSHLPITFYNPSRADWDSTWKEDIADPRFLEQTTWELDMMERATVITLCIHDAKAKAPISLLELGLGAPSGKMVVACVDGFWRRGNVQVVCQRFGIQMLDDPQDLAVAVERKLKQ